MLPNPERPPPPRGLALGPEGELRQGVNRIQAQSSASKSDQQMRGIRKLESERILSKFISPITGRVRDEGHLRDFLLEKAKYSESRNSNAKGTEEKEGKSLTPLETN